MTESEMHDALAAVARLRRLDRDRAEREVAVVMRAALLADLEAAARQGFHATALLAKVLTAQASAAYFEHRCAILLGAFKGAAVVIERAAGRLVELGDVEGENLLQGQLADLRKAVGAEVKARPAPANTRAAGH